jgi:hypothetical protein
MFHTAGKYWSHEEPIDTGCMASGDNTEKNTESGITGFHDNQFREFHNLEDQDTNTEFNTQMFY